MWVSLYNKTKSYSYPEHILVNAAERWNEGYCSYLGRSVELLAAAKHQPKRQLCVAIDGGIDRRKLTNGQILVKVIGAPLEAQYYNEQNYQ